MCSTGDVRKSAGRWLGGVSGAAMLAATVFARQTPSSDLRVSVVIARSCTITTTAPATDQVDASSLVSFVCTKGATAAVPRVAYARGEERQGHGTPDAGAAAAGVIVVNF